MGCQNTSSAEVWCSFSLHVMMHTCQLHFRILKMIAIYQRLSNSSRVHQIRFRPGLCRAYSAPPDPLATSKGRGGKERRGRGKRGSGERGRCRGGTRNEWNGRGGVGNARERRGKERGSEWERGKKRTAKGGRWKKSKNTPTSIPAYALAYTF